MRNRVFLALFLAVMLIGTASWMRLANKRAVEQGLIVQNDSETLEIYNDDSFWSPPQTSTSTTREVTQKNNTSLVSRQLIIDYIDMTTQGQATPENISALAEKYISSVPALSSAPTISQNILKVVPDSQTVLKEYESSMNSIHENFASKLKTAYGSSNAITSSNANVYLVAKDIGGAYREAATSLSQINVPQSVASVHARLVNNYLSSAVAMESLSKLEDDPVVAFAGISAMKTNFQTGDNILTEISQILIKKGI